MQGPISRSAQLFSSRSSSVQPLAITLGTVLALVGSHVRAADELNPYDPSPYYIGLNEAITHSTNVESAAGGKADTYSTTGLVGGVDQSIGRQRVYGSGNVSLNRYRDQTEFNNTSYALNAALDWQTIGRFSGTVYTRISQSLANLSNNLLQNTEGRNLVRSEQVGTRASWGGNAAVTVQAGFGHSKSSYSSPTLQASNSNDDSADIGAYYHPGQTLTLGTALRFTRSSSDQAFLLDNGTFLDNRTSGRNIDLSANWRPTAQTGANARVSWTNQSSSASGSNGFSGLTGSLSFSYAPTGKLSFSGQLNRDASTNGNFYNTFTGSTSPSSVGLAANSSVSNGASLNAIYSATAKVNVNAGVQYVRTTQSQSGAGSVPLAGYSDDLKSASLSANWAIRRYWSAGCNASHVKRTLDGAFNNNYSTTTYGCYTQVTLR